MFKDLLNKLLDLNCKTRNLAEEALKLEIFDGVDSLMAPFIE